MTYTLIVQSFKVSPHILRLRSDRSPEGIAGRKTGEKEGEDMSLEAIEKISQVEQENRERRAAADAQAKQLDELINEFNEATGLLKAL